MTLIFYCLDKIASSLKKKGQDVKTWVRDDPDTLTHGLLENKSQISVCCSCRNCQHVSGEEEK